MEPGKSVVIRVSHAGADGSRSGAAIDIVPGSREVQETETNTIALETSTELEERTGLQLADVPADLAAEIWNEDSPRCYVSGVRVGSPAYLAGFRSGDRVTEYDGNAVAGYQTVLDGLRSGETTLDLAVSGPLGSHSGPVSVVDSLETRKGFSIPLIIDYSSTIERTKTSFLDIIFQFGFNYRRTYEDSESRDVAKRSFFSLLPLGMFEFERTPTSSRNTLFWFITWKTRH